jgi:hypothetical protein
VRIKEEYLTAWSKASVQRLSIPSLVLAEDDLLRIAVLYIADCEVGSLGPIFPGSEDSSQTQGQGKSSGQPAVEVLRQPIRTLKEGNQRKTTILVFSGRFFNNGRD